jgi:chromosome segregation ATPase
MYEVVKLWLVEHLTYEEIGEKTGISIGKISEIVNTFKEKAKETSLEEAARIFGAGDEVSALLDLSKTLKEAGATVNEAKGGAALLKKLNEMGVKMDDVESWVKLCQRMFEPGFPVREFVEATIKLSKLEGESKMDYKSLISEYERKWSELKELEAKVEALKGEAKDLEGKRSLLIKLNKQISEAERKLDVYRKSINELDAKKRHLERYLEENLKSSLDMGGKAVNLLKAEMDGLSKNVEALKSERSRLEEELTAKRRELAELDRKIYEAKLQHDSLDKKYGELEALIEELQRRRDTLVEDIAKYEMEYGKDMEMVERVAAKLDGRELKVKELHDIIVETLDDEANKRANDILACWMRDGIILPVSEFTINITCTLCSKTFPLTITRDFMTRLVRGYGTFYKTPQLGPIPSIEIPRLPSPGSTTITCPSCGELIEITYEHVVGELSKAVKRKQ